jgi:hypothetical protein
MEYSGIGALQKARKMDRYFREMDVLKMDNSKPIDERSLIAAASDPNVITMKELEDIQTYNAQLNRDNVANLWESHAMELEPPQTARATRDVSPTGTPPPLPVMPVMPNNIVQTYRDIAGDLRNFSKLPYDTNLKKVQMCFLKDSRAYVSVTTVLIICLVVVIVVVACIGSRNQHTPN